MLTDDRARLELLERRLRIILPEQYQDCYEDVQPVSMGSAGLKYGPDGKVQWNEMWAAFCDLAMAGGPPHKGTYLEAGHPAAIAAHPERYQAVVDEIRRGIGLVTGLRVRISPNPGWVRVRCLDSTMSDWLLRAIVMENVAARREGRWLDLPAGPAFRIEKEIKNVITVTAKTCHYWLGHTWDAHQALIGELFDTMAEESPLIEPAAPADLAPGDRRPEIARAMAGALDRALGLPSTYERYVDWLGIEYPGVQAAVWMMRAMVSVNVLSRRETTTLFVPINPFTDPDGRHVVEAVVRTHRLAMLKGAIRGDRQS
jgi:hypothetical protein